MKKFVKLMAGIAVALLVLAGCANSQPDAQSNLENKKEDKTNQARETEEQTIPKERIAGEQEEKSIEELQEEALAFPLEIVGHKIITQDPEFKGLYPDLFSVTVLNNTEVDIRDYVVAVMAWDSNDLPIKLEAQFSLRDGEYIVPVNSQDVNLIPGGTHGEESGLPLDESMKDLTVLKAVILNYTDFDGVTIYNEAAEAFLEAIEGKTLK